MAIPTDRALSQGQRARRGRPQAVCLVGGHAGRPSGDEPEHAARQAAPSPQHTEAQTAFRTWLRVHAEATDPEMKRQAQAQLGRLMIAENQVLERLKHIRDYDELWEVHQETMAHALRKLSWLWARFGDQADLNQYLALCIHTVQARRARRMLLLPLDETWVDTTADVEQHVAQTEYTDRLWNLTTELRDFVRDHAARWSAQAPTWFEARYVEGLSETAIARRAQVRREHVHRTIRTILLDSALLAWLTRYFTTRLGRDLPEVLAALTPAHPRQETPLRPLIQTLFRWRATYEEKHHG